MEVTQYNLSGITINKTDYETSWRLIHDGTKVISLAEQSGITQSMHNIFLAATEAECHTEIYVLNLEYNP